MVHMERKGLPGIGVGAFVKISGASRNAIYAALAGDLKPAVVFRNRIDPDHPAAIAYAAKDRTGKGGRPRSVARPAPEPKPQSAPTPAPNRPPDLDPFAEMSDIAQRSRNPVSAEFEKKLRGYITGYLYDLTTATAGRMPEDVEELGEITLWEIAARFGGLQGLKEGVAALDKWAGMKNKQQLGRERRGELIERSAIEGTVFPILAGLMRRGVEEAPRSAALQVVQISLAGGEGVEQRVEAVIRKEYSNLFKGVKADMIKKLAAAANTAPEEIESQ